jgi:hypothetical protein
MHGLCGWGTAFPGHPRSAGAGGGRRACTPGPYRSHWLLWRPLGSCQPRSVAPDAHTHMHTHAHEHAMDSHAHRQTGSCTEARRTHTHTQTHAYRQSVSRTRYTDAETGRGVWAELTVVAAYPCRSLENGNDGSGGGGGGSQANAGAAWVDRHVDVEMDPASEMDVRSAIHDAGVRPAHVPRPSPVLSVCACMPLCVRLCRRATVLLAYA